MDEQLTKANSVGSKNDQSQTEANKASSGVQEKDEKKLKSQLGSGDTHLSESQTRPTLSVRNQTPKQLRIEFISGEDARHNLVFAPLEERELKEVSSEQENALKELETEGLVVRKYIRSEIDLNLEKLLTTIFYIFIAYIFIGGYIRSQNTLLSDIFAIAVPILVLLGFVILVLRRAVSLTTILRLLQKVLVLFLVLATGSALTAATIYFFGGGQDLLVQPPTLAVLVRILQFTFIVVASLFPALLYFLFDKSQLGTLRNNFEHQIFRFDPNVKTLADVNAKYGSRLDELYGHDILTAKGRNVRGTLWPILLCTLVITMGWILTLLPVGTSLKVSAASDVLGFLLPASSVIVFGFLGAYYFAVFSVSRRYTRGDLQPKAYTHIVARILIVVILAWVVGSVFGAVPSTFALMFLIGVIPETFWTVFGEFVRNQLLGPIVHSLKEKDPLTNLEGIDPYDRARLAEEGVTNIESLAHHDMIELMLASRIPVSRLVDWLDQAILYLHLPNNLHLQYLKSFGIRTATDLIQAYEVAKKEDRLNELIMVLSEPNDLTKEKKGFRLQIIHDTLLDDEWMNNVKHWRYSTNVCEETIMFDSKGRNSSKGKL